jgi:arylsulfatase A-like enzyme
MDRLNIVYIHSHDTGRHIQPYGHAVPTPNLQALAECGMVFRQAFCASPACSASRSALLTGMCPHSNGMLGLAHIGFSLMDYGKLLPHVLRKQGYFSALMGLQHLSMKPTELGYDFVRNQKWPGPCDARVVAPAAAEFLRQAPKQPFFLDVGFSQTHRPFPLATPADKAEYCLPPATLPDVPEIRADMAAFKASAREYDMGVRQVVAALEASGLMDKTIILCTTDHGLPFPGMKCNLTDYGLGVMMLLRIPGVTPAGSVCDAMVSHVDVLPTLFEILGIERPEWFEGKSFLPVLRRQADEVNDELFGELTYHGTYEPMRSVRTKRWKYIRRFGDRKQVSLSNCDNGPSKEFALKNGWTDRPQAPEQLFDLVMDPNEAHNLASAEQWAGVREDLSRRLENWMKRTRDPLLNGPVPLPAGARVRED